jgi:hypothetical protein
MTTTETYFRKDRVAFIAKTSDWPEERAREWAVDYLVVFIKSLTEQAAASVHSALLDEDNHPGAVAGRGYAEIIAEVRDREQRAVQAATADWILPVPGGCRIELRPAGDATGGGE